MTQIGNPKRVIIVQPEETPIKIPSDPAPVEPTPVVEPEKVPA